LNEYRQILLPMAMKWLIWLTKTMMKEWILMWSIL
jgi:hypothetical protein